MNAPLFMFSHKPLPKSHQELVVDVHCENLYEPQFNVKQSFLSLVIHTVV